jgi:hypothetical protein
VTDRRIKRLRTGRRDFLFDWLMGFAVSCMVAACLASVLWALVGCTAVEDAVPAGDESACERASPSGICGVVYGFAAPADNELGHVELCVRDGDLEAAEALYGPARPSWSPRFEPYATLHIDPPCFWCCAGECGRGANAYSGTFCDGDAS